MCVSVPAKILAIDNEAALRTATIEAAGHTRECLLAYVPDAQVGDYVIVQNKFAISVMSEADALESLALFGELGYLEDEGTPEMDWLPSANQPGQ
jgi:hydrogenase expression/formation protein HypC